MKGGKEKKVELNIIHVKDEWERTFDSVPDLIAIIDDKHKILKVNRALFSRLGYKPEECIGQNCFKLIHGTDSPPSNCPHTKLLEDGQEHVEEISEKRLNGDFIVSVSPLFDESKNIKGCVHVARDITESKKAGTALKESEEKYRNVIEQSSEGFILLDEKGIIIEWNNAQEIITGLKCEEVKGKQFWDVLVSMQVDEENKEPRKDQLKNMILDGMKTGSAFWMNRPDLRKIRHNDGSIRFIESLVFPIHTSKGMMLGSLNRDVTLRMKTENDIKEGEEKFRMITENTSDFITITDAEGKFIYVSPSQKRLGYDPQDLLDSGGEHFIHPDDLQKLMEDLGDFYNIGGTEKIHKKGPVPNGIESPKIVEYRIKDKWGTYHNIQDTVNPVFDGNGNIEKLVHVSKDITDKKQAETALQESEEKLRSILESSPNAITVTNLAGRIIECNQATLDLHGFSEKKEILGKNSFDFIAPEEKEKAYNGLEKTLKDGYLKNIEYTMLKKDGTKFQGELSAGLILDMDGKPSAFVGITKDITARKQTEEVIKEGENKWRSLIENTSDFIIIVDKNGIVQFINHTLPDYKMEDVIGKVVYDFQPPESQKIHKKNLKNVFKTGVSVTFQTSTLGPDDSHNWYETKIVPIKKNNIVVSAMLIATDITERKKSESELEFRLAMEGVIANISTNFIKLPVNKIDKGISQALESLGKFADVDRSYIFQFNNDNNLMNNTYEWCEEGIKPQIDELQELPTDDFGWSIDQIKRGETIHIPKLSDIPESAASEKEVFEEGEIKSLILIPMKISRKVIGFIGFDSVKAEKTWSEDIISLMKTVGGMFANTLERKRVEMELRESEERFRQFFENGPEYCYMVSPEGTFMDVNKAALNALGYKKNELIGKKISSIYAPEEKEKVNKTFNKWKKKHRLKDEELLIITKNGERRRVLLSTSWVKNNQGKIIHSISVQKDITKQKEAEKALKESEVKFRNIVQSSPMGMHIYELRSDDELVFVDSNPAADRILGLNNQQFVGKTIEEAFPPLKETVVPKKYKLAAKEGEGWDTEQLEYEDERIKGAFEVHAFQTSQDKMVTLFMDITKRKQTEAKLKESEERFRSLFDSTNEGVALHEIIYDDSGNPVDYKILDVNPAFETITGIKKEDAIDAFASELYETDEPPYLDIYSKVADTQEPTRFETTFEPMAKSFKISVFSPVKGQFATLFDDITERKNIEEQTRMQRDIGQTLSAIINLEEAAAVCVDMAIKASDMDSGGVYLVDKDTGALDLIYSIGLTPEFTEGASHYDAESSNAQLVMSGKPTYVTYSDLNMSPMPEVVPEGLRALAVIPLIYEDRIIGALNIATHSFDEISPNTRNILESIAAQIGSTIVRLQAEESLRISEDRYRMISELISDFVYSIRVEPDGTNIAEWSTKTLEKVIGMKHAELLEHGGWMNVIHPDDLPIVIKRQERLASGRSDVSEYRVMTKGGEVHWVRDYANPIWDEKENSVIRILGATQDITKQKQAEEALRESEEKYRDLVENINEVIYRIDLGGNIEYVSPTVISLLDYTPSELEGRPFKDFIHEEDLERVMKNIKSIYSGNITDHEYRIRTRSGDLRWIRTSSKPIITDKGVIGLQGSLSDITENKQAQEALRESEEKYRSLVTNIPDITWTTDSEGHTTFISPNVEEVYGYSQEEIYKNDEKLWFGRVHPDDVDRVRKEYIELFKSGKPLDTEYRIRRKDENWIWLRDRSIGTYERDGNKYADGVFFDITERKLAERALLESKERFQNLTDLLPEAVFEIDLEGVITFANKRAFELFGYTDEDFDKGLNTMDVFPPRERKTLMENIKRIIGGESIGVNEYTALNKEGLEFPVLIHSNAIIKDGKPVGLRGIVVDITERKKAQAEIREKDAQLRSVVTSAPIVLWALDQDGVFTLSEGKAMDALGLEKDQVVGHSVFDVYKEVPQIVDENKRALQGDEFSSSLEMGDLIWETFFSPLKDQRGKIIGSIGVATDITRRKKAENEREILFRELKHRVKNNLQLLSSMVDMQIMRSDDPKLISKLQETQSVIDTIALIYSRAYEGIEMVGLNLNIFIEELLNGLMKFKTDDDLIVDHAILGDKIKLSTDYAIPMALIANELVFNALKHAFKGREKGRISISLKDEVDTIIMSVSDDGVGLDPAIDLTKSDSFGLKIVRNLSSQLNGTIETRLDNGTEFIIKVPKGN